MTTPDMEAIQSLFDGCTRTDANGWAKHCRALFDQCRELESERDSILRDYYELRGQIKDHPRP